MLTYFLVHLFFIIPVILVLAIIAFRKRDQMEINRRTIGTILVMVLIAVLYTIPWDSYLITKGVWYYDHALVSNMVFLVIPLEELLFFVLETILVSLAYLVVVPVTDPKPNSLPQPRWLIPLLMLAWINSIWLLVGGYQSLFYLALIVVWALPPIILQLGIGWKTIRGNIVRLGAVISSTTLYLSVVDAIAIANGIWAISTQYSTSILPFGLPIEELVFFLVTSVLVTLGMHLARRMDAMQQLKKQDYFQEKTLKLHS